MALIHQDSKPSISSQVDLFSLPFTSTTVDMSLYAETKPLVSIASNGKIDFRILPSASHYLDAEDSFLYLKCKVVKEDGSNFAATDDYSVSNSPLHSMFSQVDVYLNNQPVSMGNSTYSYKSYFENLFKNSFDHRTEMLTGVFSPDTHDFVLEETNVGYKERKAIVSESKEFELCGKLFVDLASQKRFILNDTSLLISLTRNKDAFAILSKTLKGKIIISDASFFIRRHILYPSITLSHQKLLEKGLNAKYPYVCSEVRNFIIPKGNSSFFEDNLFLGAVPARIIVGMVLNKAFEGSFDENPYKFEDFKLSQISMQINNISVPFRPLTIDVSNNNYLLGYYLLYKCVSKMNNNRGLLFTPNAYVKGYTLFGFDINPLALTDSCMYLETSGSVKLQLSFSRPLAEAVTLLVYAESQKVMEIDKQRQASTS